MIKFSSLASIRVLNASDFKYAMQRSRRKQLLSKKWSPVWAAACRKYISDEIPFNWSPRRMNRLFSFMAKKTICSTFRQMNTEVTFLKNGAPMVVRIAGNAEKRAFDSLTGAGFTGFDKRAFDSLTGSGFTGFDKRSLDSPANRGFTHFDKRFLLVYKKKPYYYYAEMAKIL